MEREDSGFFTTLFNWDFTEFLTLRIIKVSYIFWVVFIAIYVVGGEYYSGRYLKGGSQFAAIILVPVVGLFLLVYFRVVLELTFVFFRSERHLRKIAQND